MGPLTQKRLEQAGLN
jgi:signal peptidase I